MLAYTYVENGRFELIEKEKPMLLDSRDAVVKITLASICSSDLHINMEQYLRQYRGLLKNLIFKTGGVDGCDCEEILRLVEQGKLDTTALITHTSPSYKKSQTIPMKTIKKWKFA